MAGFKENIRSKFNALTHTNEDHHEGPVARTIENQTAKIPSDVFLWAAVGSIGASLTLNMTGKRDQALFVGQWAPTFLLLGIYNKLVKIAGSDQHSIDTEYQGYEGGGISDRDPLSSRRIIEPGRASSL